MFYVLVEVVLKFFQSNGEHPKQGVNLKKKNSN